MRMDIGREVSKGHHAIDQANLIEALKWAEKNGNKMNKFVNNINWNKIE